MRLDELDWFVKLVDLKNVTRASERLHISQPTLSRAVNRLEAEVRASLFQRNAGGWVLTDAGEVLFAHAVRALSEIDSARARIRALTDPEGGTIALAYVTSFGSWLVPKLVQEFGAARSRLALRGGPADEVLELVRAGTVDIGITSPRPAGSQLDWTPLAAEELGLAIPRSHWLAGRASVAPEELGDELFIALHPEFGLRQISDEYFASHGVRPIVVMETTELQTVRGFVAQGSGVAILPLRQASEDLAVVPFRDRKAIRVAGAVTDPMRTKGHAANRFIEFVHQRAFEDRSEH